MNLGLWNTLRVVRESDIAYILTDGQEEIFLHKKEALKAYQDNELIDVFLYVDNQGRITASTKIPFITMETAAFLEVVSNHPKFGVFLNNNLVKDLLLSLDDLPLSIDSWPQVGDFLFVGMKEKKGHLFAKIIGRKQVASYFDAPALIMEVGTITKAYVSYIIPDGIVCLTSIGEDIFIHQNNLRKTYRLGEEVSPKILSYNSSSAYTGTLIDQKELMIPEDAKRILSYLENHYGEMRFTDKSSPDEISYLFGMSKSAFKRALGSLYKQGYIELHETKTILKKHKGE